MSQSERAKRPTMVRFAVLLALALAAASAYLTRVCISVANTTIQRELAFTNEQMGDILAAFAVGYLLFQVPGGWLGTRFGARLVLPVLSVGWSLCTVWTGVAVSLTGLWCSRVAFGLAQAGLVPCSAKVLRDWFPDARRGIASATLGSSMSIGAVVASGLTALLLEPLGWRNVFVAYSIIGPIWAVAFYVWFRNRPEDHPRTNRAEQDLIRDATRSRSADEEASSAAEVLVAVNTQSRSGPNDYGAAKLALAMATSSSMWAICGQSFCRAFGYAFFITWFPAFLEKGLGAEVRSAGLLTMVPLATVVVGSLAGGYLIDSLLAWTGSKWISRSGTAFGALGLCAACVLSAAWARTPVQVTMVIGCGSFFSGLGNPAAWAATMDISGRHTAVVFGIMNMAGVLGGIACPKVVAHLFSYIEQTAGDWNLVLYLFAAVYTAGALCWLAVNPLRSAVEPPAA